MLDAETFDMSIYETFSTVLSNGTRVELQPGGYDKNVTHKNHKKPFYFFNSYFH